MLAVLRQRNFAPLWFGQLISLVGDSVPLLAPPRPVLGSVAGVFVGC